MGWARDYHQQATDYWASASMVQYGLVAWLHVHAIITSLVAIYFSETVKVSNGKGIESWNLAQIQVNMENDYRNIKKIYHLFLFSSYTTLKRLTIT